MTVMFNDSETGQISNSGAPAGWYDLPDRPGMVGWWDGTTWSHVQFRNSGPQQVVVTNLPPRKINHILHLLLTFFTGGLWAIVWIILAIKGAK